MELESDRWSVSLDRCSSEAYIDTLFEKQPISGRLKWYVILVALRELVEGVIIVDEVSYIDLG